MKKLHFNTHIEDRYIDFESGEKSFYLTHEEEKEAIEIYQVLEDLDLFDYDLDVFMHELVDHSSRETKAVYLESAWNCDNENICKYELMNQDMNYEFIDYSDYSDYANYANETNGDFKFKMYLTLDGIDYIGFDSYSDCQNYCIDNNYGY